MKRSFVRSIGAAIAALGTSSLVAAPSASADTCVSTEWCLWKDILYQGGLGSWVGNDSNYTDNYFDSGGFDSLNDEASAARNSGTCSGKSMVWAYYDVGYSGWGDWFGCGQGRSDLGQISSNDVWSSHLWTYP